MPVGPPIPFRCPVRLDLRLDFSRIIQQLATPEHEQSISRVFQYVGRKYVQSFNTTTRSNGTLWEACFRATLVGSKRYLLTVIRDIKLNPVRARLVLHRRVCPWSSCARNARADTGANSHWIKPHA